MRPKLSPPRSCPVPRSRAAGFAGRRTMAERLVSGAEKAQASGYLPLYRSGSAQARARHSVTDSSVATSACSYRRRDVRLRPRFVSALTSFGDRARPSRSARASGNDRFQLIPVPTGDLQQLIAVPRASTTEPPRQRQPTIIFGYRLTGGPRIPLRPSTTSLNETT
jgi:hypothetical protein